MAADLAERVAALERYNIEIKRKLAEVGGQFEFISGQLRAVQAYVRDRFDQVDHRLGCLEAAHSGVASRLEQVDRRLDRVDVILLEIKGELVALPREVAEMFKEGRS